MLRAARAGAAMAWVAALTACVLVTDHPLMLAALGASAVVAALLTGSTATVARASLLSLPLAVGIIVVNALLSREGVTVVARLGDVPVVGRIDVTAEALAHGALLAGRATVVAMIVVLFACCVDQDGLVGLLRRRAGRLGLAATLAARMVPLVAADGRRAIEARRCLPEAAVPSRTATMTALATGALDRAGDAAASLEMRGLGSGPCLAAASAGSGSRHDRSLLISAIAVPGVVFGAQFAGWTAAGFLPRAELALGGTAFAAAAAVLLLAVFPLLDRRGVAG